MTLQVRFLSPTPKGVLKSMTLDGIEYGDEMTFGNNVPCFNRGCRNHVLHPCEMCGRKACRGVGVVKMGFMTVSKEKEVPDFVKSSAI